jgi:hypothetical protein
MYFRKRTKSASRGKLPKEALLAEQKGMEG